VASFSVTQVGTILAVREVDRSVAFYRDRLCFAVEATYDDPPYATLTRAGARLSLAEQGHPAEDRPGVTMVAPSDPSQLGVLVLGRARMQRTPRGGAQLVNTVCPPWGGLRFFVVDPDGYLVEIEQPG
jgi:catechol 2,3-dioxygenase-like lactoylglutathione lyase family enzyme